MTIGIKVRRAMPQEIDTLATTLALAFQDDPISSWIFPDAALRVERHPAFFRVPVQDALENGEVYTTPDYDGVAVWFPIDVTGPPDPAAHAAAFKQACGHCYDRFHTLDQQMASRHPTSRNHVYLAFIGVLPERTGHGVGSALLRDRLRRCDEDKLAAYLENSNPYRNSRLYRRFGFCGIGAPIQLPNGPQMHPMWRSPSPLHVLRGEQPPRHADTSLQ